MNTPKSNTTARTRARAELNKIKKNTNLAQLLDNKELRQKAVQALEDGLNATRTYWDGFAKQMFQEPDHRVRASVAVDILHFTDGKPVERKEIVNYNFDSLEELQRRAENSPAMQAALARVAGGSEQKFGYGASTNRTETKDDDGINKSDIVESTE